MQEACIGTKDINVVSFKMLVDIYSTTAPAAVAFGFVMNRKIILLVLLTSWFVPKIAAQNIFNAPYSVYGIGMIHDRQSSLNSSMGGTGIGVQDGFNLNHANPASYGAIQQPINHIYEIGFYTESNRLSTRTTSESHAGGGLTHINYWFRFKPWWSATAGLSPYSSVSYNITTKRELGSGTDVPYTYSGNGNISSLYMGNSFKLSPNLLAGINVSYLFGAITKDETIELSTGAMTFSRKITARKLTVDAGLQYKIKIGDRSLVLGAVADNGVTLNGRVSHSLYTENADTLESGNGKAQTYKIPASAGFGFGLHAKRSIIAMDLRFKNWQQASFANEDVVFQNTWKLSAGYQYKGNPDATSYLGLISLRAGAYAQQFQINMKGNNFPVWGYSFGVSMPVFDNKSSINLTYNFDKLGTTQNGLIQQRSQKIMFEVVIRDLWGVKRKFD